MELAVQLSKLSEWLLARRVIPDDYARLLAAIQARVSEALQENISDKVAQSLIDAHREDVHYFAALDIYEAISKSADGQSKTLLGSHTHPGAAKWKAVVDAYRKKHLGWASAARVLNQNASYEIPALKKQAAACERQVSDCSSKQAEFSRQENNARIRHQELLVELGIAGFNPRQELRAYAKQELPRLNSEVLSLLREFAQELIAYYRAYADHAAGKPVSDADFLPILRLLSRPGELPRIEDLELEVPLLKDLREDAARKTHATTKTQATAAAPAPDVLEGVKTAPQDAPAADINWDFEIVDSGDVASGIDWGFEVSTSGVEENTSGAPDGGGIDWGAISFDGLEMQAEEAQDSSNSSDDALLNDLQVRELLTREVFELVAFLSERSAELQSSGGDGEEYGPRGIQKSRAEVQKLLELVRQAEELLCGKQTQRLLLLGTSERYLDQVVKRIELAKLQCSKPVVRRAELDKVKADQAEEAKRARDEADKLRIVTKKIQSQLEAELSAHFKSMVRIVGEIG